eukprot:238467-Prorocentrum_minimum.AAC.1
MYCTTRLEDVSGILHFIVSVPRFHSASTLDRCFPSSPSQVSFGGSAKFHKGPGQFLSTLSPITSADSPFTPGGLGSGPGTGGFLRTLSAARRRAEDHELVSGSGSDSGSPAGRYHGVGAVEVNKTMVPNAAYRTRPTADSIRAAMRTPAGVSAPPAPGGREIRGENKGAGGGIAGLGVGGVGAAAAAANAD